MDLIHNLVNPTGKVELRDSVGVLALALFVVDPA
jgi:hypothetical protein